MARKLTESDRIEVGSAVASFMFRVAEEQISDAEIVMFFRHHSQTVSALFRDGVLSHEIRTAVTRAHGTPEPTASKKKAPRKTPKKATAQKQRGTEQ